MPLPPLGVKFVIAALQRHALLIGLCTALFAGIGVAYTKLSPKVYEAGAMVRFEAERVNMPQLVEMLVTDKTISTEVEVLKSRASAVAVIDSLGLRARIGKPKDAPVSSVFAWWSVPQLADSGTLVFTRRADKQFDIARSEATPSIATARVGDTTRVGGIAFVLSARADSVPAFTLHVDPLEVAVGRVTSSLNIAAPSRDVDLINIRARSVDPAQAAAIANLLAHNVIEDRQSFRSGRTDAAATFLEQQSDSLGRQMRATEDSLRAYQQREHVIDVPQQASAEVARLASLQANLAGLRAERDAAASLVSQFREDSINGVVGGQSASRRLVGFPALLGSQSASVLLGALAQVESERSQLLIRRVPGDSDVVALTRRARDIELQLSGIATSYLRGLSDQVASLERESQGFRSQLDALPAKALQTARLERDSKVLNDLWVLVQTRLKEAQASGVSRDPAMRIVDAAVAPTKPIRPRMLINLALALVFGTSAGVAIALLLAINDKAVRSRDDAERVTGLPVLSALPRLAGGRPNQTKRVSSGSQNVSLLRGTRGSQRAVSSVGSHLISNPDVPGSYTESLNQLFASLAWGQLNPRPRSLVFTSPLPGEGKTLSALNFALHGAARRLNVLLIDADLRCGVVSASLGIKATPGFSDLLAQTVTDADAIQIVQVPDVGTLSVIASGDLPRMPGAIFTQERVKDILVRLAPRYDLVVIDSPPVNLLADAAILGSAADAVVLVVRAGFTQADDLNYAMDQLASMRATVIGTILNDIDLRHNSRDDGSYRYLEEAARYGRRK